MYNLEKFLGASYEYYEEKVSNLFSFIKSRCMKHSSSTPTRPLNNFAESRSKGIRELLKLSNLVNYDSSGKLPKTRSQVPSNASTPLCI